MIRWVIGIFLTVSVVAHAAEMRLAVPEYPPYTYEKDGKIVGIGCDAVDKIMQQAKIKYTLTFFPNYGRVLLEMKSNNIDGFFLASANEERDAIADFSDAVVLNNWVWVTLKNKKIDFKSEAAKRNYKVAALLNTNIAKYLKDNNFTVQATPDSNMKLIQMLKADRIDGVLFAELVFKDALKEAKEDLNNYTMTIEKVQPFGIYVSKEYLAKNPDTMKKINDAIKKVAAAGK